MTKDTMTREEVYDFYLENGLTSRQAARALQIIGKSTDNKFRTHDVFDRLQYTLGNVAQKRFVSPEFNEKCRMAGVAPRADLLNRYPDKSHEEIIAELAKSKVLREHCKSFGVSESSVKTIIKNLCISDDTAMKIVEYLSTKTFPYKIFVNSTREPLFTGDKNINTYKYIIDGFEETYGGVYDAVYRLMQPRHLYWKPEEYMPICMSEFYKIHKLTLPKASSYLDCKRESLVKFAKQCNNGYNRVNNNFGAIATELITDEELNNALALIK